MRVLRQTVLLGASLMLLAGMAAAADLRVLSVEETQNAVRALGAEFKKETAQEINLTISVASEVMQKIKAGVVFDMLIASEATMDELDGEGLVNPESRVPLATAASSQAKLVYEGALMSDGTMPELARSFIRFLASPEARAQWIDSRLEPLADR